MIHKGIQFSLDEIEPGVWRWEYELGGQAKSGRFQVSSRAGARRRAILKIDFDLRSQWLAERARVIKSDS